MMPYIFCLLVDLARVACIGLLGWMVYRGASAWLVVAIIFLAMSIVIPGNDIFTCPKCGHIDKVKVFSTSLSDEKGVPPKSNDD